MDTNAFSALAALAAVASLKGMAILSFTGLLRRLADTRLLAMTTYLLNLYQ